MTLLILGALIIAGCQQVPQSQNETLLPIEIAQIATGEETSIPAAEETQTVTAEVKPETNVVLDATEGDLVHLRPEAVDPDEDVVNYFFTEPFDSNGKWQTKEGDAGKYVVTVTATDGKANTTEEVTIVVHKAKKAPVIECPEEITVHEGDMITLNCNIYDPEGDQTVIEYSGFMKGPTYETTFEDAGEYTTLIKAKNKYKESQKTIKIQILNKNREPRVFLPSETITGTETDIITITPQVDDPDGDKVKLSFSEPFDGTGSWKTKIGDAGSYTVSVVATDGKLTAKKDVAVQVKMRNTAPTLKNIDDITVYEGETVKLPIDVYDREGDEVKVTVKGWMNSESYTTTYDDAGTYSVTVIASDGSFESSQTFKVTVVDRNRPPVFKVPA
ncbi:hypothetical protein JW826_03660 [Candidatus Woesearchaeota archaeon]|nr:hypothetical protein [Candidatus Woesearchaeota archaeon]